MAKPPLESGRAPHVGLRVGRTLAEAIDRLAAERGLTRSELVRMAVAAYVTAELEEVPQAS